MTNENLAWVRTLKIPGIPQFGAKMYELFHSLQSAVNTVAQQANANPSGTPSASPTINNLTVQASNGHFIGAITDNNEVRRGINYWIEHADNPHFTNPQIVHLGNARNWHAFLGNYTGFFARHPVTTGVRTTTTSISERACSLLGNGRGVDPGSAVSSVAGEWHRASWTTRWTWTRSVSFFKRSSSDQLACSFSILTDDLCHTSAILHPHRTANQQKSQVGDF